MSVLQKRVTVHKARNAALQGSHDPALPQDDSATGDRRRDLQEISLLSSSDLTDLQSLVAQDAGCGDNVPSTCG